MKKYISVLNVFACFAVIVLHTNGVIHTFSYERYWVTANVLESLFYFAVPIFFLISGATLLDYRKKYKTKDFLKKRFVKTLVPFLAWTVLGLLFEIFVRHKMQDISIKDFISKTLTTQIVGIYWFFIPLLAMYLSVPLLSAVAEEKRKSVYTYTVIVAFLLNAVYPLLAGLTGIAYNASLSLPVAGGFIIYVLLGYLIDNYPIPRLYRWCAYLLGILAALVQFYGTLHFSYQRGETDFMFKGYLNVPAIFYSVAIFIFFKSMDHTKLMAFFYRFARRMSSRTFGIYLIHHFVLERLFFYELVDPISLLFRVVGPFAVFAVCYILTAIIQKLPLIKYIIPK